MANIQPPLVNDPFLHAMVETLALEMTEYLKAPLMALAEEKINESVQAAVAAMRPRIEAYVKHYDMSVVINVITGSEPPHA